MHQEDGWVFSAFAFAYHIYKRREYVSMGFREQWSRETRTNLIITLLKVQVDEVLV